MLDFIHNDLEFSNLLAIVSANLSVDITLVEKDYWIMHALYSLQQQNIEFELKGGTYNPFQKSWKEYTNFCLCCN
jgi:hypothetical protein